MRVTLAVWMGVAATAMIMAQPGPDARVTAQLRQLFPSAAAFSPKSGTPPHYEAWSTVPGPAAERIGVAIWTTDLDPLERGYDGPVKILVGLDLRGTITGIVVADHHEPYGYFSVDLPAFAAQFKGKSVRDPFRVGGDVDAISRATLTVTSAARAIRNSARRAATALITPPR
ncbi:MAG TPA: FMN-binding protein [Vicinamibacterales bacterium]|nr:FMN-binding protein [Vicinamibacterales bacterium]